MNAFHYILGSRSPRRLELLKLLVPGDRIVVMPPLSPEEAGFAGLIDAASLRLRLAEIVSAKMSDVNRQILEIDIKHWMALVADTIIVASETNSTPVVLGQPPEVDWQATVRHWLMNHYSGRTHEAWTGVCLWNDSGILLNEIVKTAVTFRRLTPAEIDWYLSTEESLGKAGGYALQGLASLFVDRVDGSLSNVVGLPLETVRKVVAPHWNPMRQPGA